jgi:hypothetical protein
MNPVATWHSGRRFQTTMTEQDQDDPNVSSAFKKVTGKTLPKRTGVARLPIRGRRRAARQTKTPSAHQHWPTQLAAVFPLVLTAIHKAFM